MDPYKDKILRKSYYSKITKKPKHKQVKVKNFASEAAATAYLDEWKAEAIRKENELITNQNNKTIIIEKDIIEPAAAAAVIEVKEEPKQEIIINPELPPQINEFNLNVPDFKKDGNGISTVIIAASNSGKTTITKYIINEWFNNKNVITTIMCPNINIEIYKNIKKDKNLITVDFFSEDMLKGLSKIQRKTENKYNFALFLDDIIDEKNAQQIINMMLTYRNLNISGCINIQDTKLIPRTIRHNANNFIFLRQSSHDAITDIMELFLKSYPPFINLNKDNKVVAYRELTKNHGFIYLNALEDKISFHKAVPK